ncbi:hypothetical protein Bca52824_011430 [Brassica carinata]|uniref:Uncharacterized protein n=1 Tax=Brassica carinata TaxID=52824 RepID=A0A8X8BBN2_BRACI|nr:hypothetical protein Bca52824_011430 [Brassica carinata]
MALLFHFEQLISGKEDADNITPLFTWGWNQRGTLGHPPETKTESQCQEYTGTLRRRKWRCVREDWFQARRRHDEDQLHGELEAKSLGAPGTRVAELLAAWILDGVGVEQDGRQEMEWVQKRGKRDR